MAFSVSIMRLVKYVVRGFSILYCRPYFNSSVSSSVNLIFVRFLSYYRIRVVPDCWVCFWLVFTV